MRIADLEYYIALASYRNFSQVSDRFNVSQPTISLAMQRLEKEMGTELLKRNKAHKNLTLTYAGQVFLQHADTMVEQYKLAQTEIQRITEHSLLIGLPPIIQIAYFPDIAMRLSDQVLTHLRTQEIGAHEALNQLKSGELDASFIGHLDPIDQADFDLIDFDERPFAILVSEKHPLAARSSVSFAELVAEQFILLKGNFVHSEAFDRLARASHSQNRVIFTSSQPYGILSMIKQNRGIGFMVDHPALQLAGVKAIPLSDADQPLFRVGFAARKDTILTADQETIFQELVQATKLD
ncbi:LysR substrate-binding domain-containing protein [Leuconostocaceae bacterium ESL0958]|nr:LysR substrate-binding domain-containing protein [Leuconostocaceae bacterium ESL0958]